MRRLNIVAAWLVLLTSVIAVPTYAGALAGGIDACFFRDLNGSSVQGDNANDGANDEVAFTESLAVELVDLTTPSSSVVVVDPVTGCAEFPGLTDGSSYELRAVYPSEFYSSPTGGDTDFVPGPPPSVAGDPFTASYSFTFASGDDLSVTGGVSGSPELSLGYFITPSGDRMIETGTGPFDTTGDCPTQAPGDDCETYDNVVRTNDVTTIGYTITADNIPDGDTNPLNDVILEQVITPNPNAVVEVPSLHPSCLTTGVSPASSIDVDPTTGVITVTCNLGTKDNGTSIVPTYIRTDGSSWNESTFTVDARVYTSDDRAQVFDDSSMLAPEDITISAAPRFDITKGNDASNPYNRVVYYQTTQRLNPVTGITEFGANYQWDISVLYDGGAKGQAALAGPITFSDIIPAEFVGWEIVGCNSTPYGAGNMPNDDRPEEDWGDRGNWSCVADRANNEIDITVTNVDTDGDPIPTEGSNGNDLSAGPYFAFAGSVRIWYPLSDFYRTIDPSWTDGDDPIEGDYPLDNLVGNFDPEDATGQSNFGDDEEPLENNDRSLSVPIRERGGFSKHLGSYEWADARVPDGTMTGTASTWPCSSADAGSLMSGQTQACSQGDAPVQPGELAHFWYWLRNDGTFPWASDTVALCDAFDNSTMALTTWTGGETVYVRAGLPEAAIIVEYATADFNDDVAGNDWTNQLAAVRDCTAPNNDWSTDPYSFDADPDASLDQIGMIRVRLDDSIHPEVLPSEYMQVSFPVEIRETFNGGPNAGQPIPVGTIMANNANRQFGSTPYSATFMEAASYSDSPWGDRMILNRHQVRITKTTSIDAASPTDDDLFNVQGSDTVVWWLQPAVTAVTPAVAGNVQVVDTLPAGITFDAFCQANQAYPDSNVVLTSVTDNGDGTTTLLFDLGDRNTNEPIGPIPVCTTVDNFLDPGTDLINNVEISSDGDVSPASARTADRTISVVAAGEFQLVKEVDAPLELQLDTQTYTIGWTNLSDDFDFSPPDVIDVWPYNGDATNPLNQRNEFDSNYTGSYELTDWMAQPTTTLAGGATEVTGGTWYYSADDPATIPYDADTAANDLATGSVNWCTQAELTAGASPCDFTFSDSTAVRFVQSDVLISRSSVLVEYTFQAGTVGDPNAPSDRYVNRFAARTDSVDDLIRSNEVLVQVLSMNLGDLVFLDADVDGRFTSGVDVPISGTTVELWSDDGAGTFVFADTTTTDANGRYVFEELLQNTYEIRIPDAELSGGTLDTWTQTINPLPADNDDNEGVDQQASDSGLGYTTSGPVVLSANTVVDPPIGLEPTGENLFNLGSPYTFDNLSNLTVDLGFRGDPAVQIIKEVCDAALGSCDLTTDALDPSDGWVETAVVPFTDTATWRITVSNIGDEVLANISVDDDAEATCDRAAGTIPDLGIGESFAWTCSTTNVLADILNTAEVTAFGIGSGTEVDDSDSAAVETPPANNDIEVTKFINGADAQTAPGVLLDPGDAVTFTYEVTTGSGTVPLGNIAVVDDNGTPTNTGDDFNATYVSGDTDNDDILDLGETWLYQASGFTAVTGQYANWATATGLPLTAGSTEVSDIDPAHYYGVDAGVALSKFVNGQDADTAPGVLIEEGTAVSFTYEVRNTGNAPLTVTSFSDDAGTPGAPGDDWTPTYVSGDTDLNNELDVSEVWIYEHTGEVAVSGQYTNIAALVVEDPVGNSLPASDPANYFGASPAIAVEKATNTIDADVDPVLVAEGSPVVWTYELTNAGNVPVSNPRVLDDGGTPADPADDFYAAYVSGDVNNDGLLDVTETWSFRASSTATEESYRNNAQATGRGPVTVDEDGNSVPGEEVTSEDPSSYFAANPGIAIVKSTNGVDNSAAPGVFIAEGDAVTWTYSVTNPGNVALSNVSVIDDNGTAAVGDDLAATYVSGDANGDDFLDVDETWLFEATGVATAGQYSNNAVVTGRPPLLVNPDGSVTLPDLVTDEDDDFYFGSTPDVAIVKSTNGVDNSVAPGVFVAEGDAVTWTYSVTNPGNVALSNVSVIDDNGTAAVGDDFAATYVSGDANGDDFLDVDETWLFEATGVATAGQYSNNAVVTGTPPTVTNPDGSTTVPTPVTDDDDDFYFGAAADISVAKATNTVDSSVAPGVFLAPGDAVTWTYSVTNPGNVALSNVSVIDDNGTAAVGDDFAATYVSGDANGDDFLDVDETWLFEATGVATAGQYSNNAVVTGTPPTVTNPDGSTTVPTPVTDDDDDFYFGAGPGIAITKFTNGVDNTTAPGVLVPLGDAVVWTYAVTNTGDVALSDVAVVDDNGTPADVADDLTVAFVSGDDNGDDLLDVDETWTFEATGVATVGQYGNNAEVSGTPPTYTNPDGSTTVPSIVTDDDDDFYFGSDPSIEIAKATNSVDSSVAPGVFIIEGDVVTWTYTVTNPGNVVLAEVGVVDDNGTPADPADDLTATYISGDANGDTLLDLDEVWVFEASGIATSEQYANNAVVSGTPPTVTNPDGSTTVPDPVTDDDDDFYFGAAASISVVKTVNGDDANVAPGVLVPVGDDVSWEYMVTNTGNTPLIDVAVADDMGVVVTCPASTLDVGEAMVCTGPAEPAALGQYTNIGTATGTPAAPTGDVDNPFTAVTDPDTGLPVAPVTDDDPANHFGTGPGVEIQKQVCDLDDTASCDLANDDHWVEVTVVSDGDTAVWRMTVTNIGNVDLADVTVTDPLAPDCDRIRPLLGAGETWAFTCELTNVMEPTTNTGFVEATSTTDPDEPPVTDDDIAETVEPAELAMQKNVDVSTVSVGDTVTYTLAISNTGVSDATDIEILDTLPDGLGSITIPANAGLVIDEVTNTITWTLDSLPVGATRTVSYTAVVTGTGSILNSVRILSNHEENNLTNNQDDAIITSTPGVRPSPLAYTGSSTQQLLLLSLFLMTLGVGFVLFGRRRTISE